MKTAFRERREKLRYAKFIEAACRLRQPQAMIDDARAFVPTHMQTDSQQRTYADRSLTVVGLPVEMIIDTLLADSPEGDPLRDTAPPFGPGFASREVAELIDRMHA